MAILGYIIAGVCALIVGLVGTFVTVKIFEAKTGIKLFRVKRGATPETAKKEYDKRKGDLDEIEVTVPADGTEYYRESQLEKRIMNYRKQADRLWGKKALIDRYRSAYFYALAAYACYKAKNLSGAGLYYHFAGHGFWRLGEYNLAGMCYKWSGDLYVADSKYLNARRAYRRAMQVFSDSGFYDIREKIKPLEKKVNDEIDAPEMGWWDEPGAFRKGITY